MTRPTTKTNLHPYNGAPAPFEAFLPFVRVRDREVRDRFVAALHRLHADTSDIWKPGACISVPWLHRQLIGLQAVGETTDLVGPRVMNFAVGCHFFIDTQVQGYEPWLVIDAAGVYTSGVDYHHNKRSVTPYFGEHDLAPDPHQHIYNQAIPGYRRFTP